MSLTRIDRDAMKRAIEIVRRRDQKSREQIDEMLRDDKFEEVGSFAAFSAQIDALHLLPWQPPPLYAVRGEALELRERMERLGLSKFEPDPVAACEAAEAKAAS
jgi:hypothetical protein